MKYIRTKNGIYEYVGYDNECIIPSPIIKCKDKLTHCLNSDIIQQADTIEELCDEFIEYGNRPIVITQANVKEGRMRGKTPVILGAIWTNKGLIYVAKINEKGELELL